MREMTTSKTPWISEYPADWDQVPLHALFGEHKNKNKDGAEQNLLSLSYGNIIRKDINTNEGLLPESFNGYNIIDEGEIVLRLTDLQNDHRSLRTGLVKEHGIITSAYVTLRKKAPLSSEYYHYLLHAFDIMKVFYSMGEGIRQSLGYDELAYTIIPRPPLPEQQAIVRYLDSKCSAIDEAIERHKKIIEKLEEYRRFSIKVAVTKGLSSMVMKDSGVAWIGQIPASWQVASIKRLADIQTGSTPSKKGDYGFFDDNNGTPWIKPENLDSLQPIHATTEYLTDAGLSEGRSFPPYTIFVCCIASVGKVGYSDITCSCNQQINGLTFDENKMNWKYAFYALLSAAEEHVAKANRSVQMIINSTQQSYIKLPWPGITEQKLIVQHLDNMCNKVEDVIKRHAETMNKLEEYRKSIIYNAVTGKIDCREATK